MTNKNFKISLSKLPEKLENEKIDAFIFSASYEARCLKIAMTLSKKDSMQIYFCKNEDPHAKALNNIELIKETFGDKPKEILLNKSDPIKTIDAFIEPLTKCSEDNSHVLVDISCFTHESLLILQKVIRHLKVKVTYAYCPAGEYNPQAKDDDDKWFSRGIGEVRSVLGYSGTKNPLKGSHLIVLVGFEVERARKLIDRYEPTYLSLGYAEDEIVQNAGERNKKQFDELISFYSNVKKFSFSASDIQMTKDAIKHQVKEFDEANPLVAPMNTKISTLALSQAAEEDDRIQICYASALLYNVDDYSEPSDECILFTLN